MTVGANVKSSYFSIKSAEASLEQLAIKSNNKETKKALYDAQNLLSQVKEDLKKQIQFLAREEPQYK
ncbi:DUF1657 domain-containing protein [Pseudogracilibacillus sp. SE30717A]|uniref:DUF1657 domain-containing protein n=1 Tax=Pseudogracilibacillus sp. SE30717A TaxID=3098293 RepID=UPI00300DD773